MFWAPSHKKEPVTEVSSKESGRLIKTLPIADAMG